MHNLTHKQKCFIYEYLKDLNATQAACRAGYSVKTARQIGSRLLTFVDIQEEIKRHFIDAHAKQQKELLKAAEVAIKALIDVAKNGSGSARVSAANSILERANHKISDKYNFEGLIKNTTSDQQSSVNSFLDRLYGLACDGNVICDNNKQC